jgi:hypothetical protein
LREVRRSLLPVARSHRRRVALAIASIPRQFLTASEPAAS